MTTSVLILADVAMFSLGSRAGTLYLYTICFYPKSIRTDVLWSSHHQAINANRNTQSKNAMTSPFMQVIERFFYFFI